MLRRDPSKPRAIEILVERAKRVTRPSIPLVGQVAAGEPILAEENIEDYLEVPAVIGGDDGDYILQVRGDSMQDAGILDGDFVVVQPADDADNGEIVVALIEDEATVKRFFREEDRSASQPANEPTSRSSPATRGCSAGSSGSSGGSAHDASADIGATSSRAARRPARRRATSRVRLATLEDVVLGALGELRAAGVAGCPVCGERSPVRRWLRRLRLRARAERRERLAASAGIRLRSPCGSTRSRGRYPSRKVRTPQGKAVGNAHPGKPAGKCHRNIRPMARHT